MRKIRYCEEKWERSWVRTAKKTVEDYYQEFKRTLNSPFTDSPPQPPVWKEIDKYNEFDIHEFLYGDDTYTHTDDDELQRYLEAPVLKLPKTREKDDFDPLNWWKNHESEYPILARIAYNMFAIPSSSVEPERVLTFQWVESHSMLLLIAVAI